MKKALLFFGFFSIALSLQSCTSDTDEFAPVGSELLSTSVSDTIPPQQSNQTTTDNGDLGKDLDKKK